MGHADRPWLHNDLSLDAQSRRVCVPAARCPHSDANTDYIAFSYGYAHGNSHCDADSYSDGNTNRNRYTWAGDSNAKGAPHTASASGRRLLWGWDRWLSDAFGSPSGRAVLQPRLAVGRKFLTRV